MIDWTNTHFRFFMRLLCPQALLYTEMHNAGAVINYSHRVTDFNAIEHPLVLQLGGNEPEQLAKAAIIAKQIGYDQINLNIGCPSPRVKAGAFGACLMAEPHLVANCVDAMKSAVDIPVTVKTRLGIDNLDSFDFLVKFIQTVAGTGCNHFIIHARKAWLSGLNPKQNRTIPPLLYDRVYKLKQLFADLHITINGGIETLEQVNEHLKHIDSVMLGRLAINDPYHLAQIHQSLYQNKLITRTEALNHYLDYVESKLNEGVAISLLLKPLFSLFNGLPGAKKWRQLLSATQIEQANSFASLQQHFSNAA